MEDNTNNTLTEAEVIEATAASNTYTLTEDEKAQLTGISSEMQELQREASAVLKSIARARGLNGNWQFNPATNTFHKA